MYNLSDNHNNSNINNNYLKNKLIYNIHQHDAHTNTIKTTNSAKSKYIFI